MNYPQRFSKGMTISAWFAYVAIVLEILYMISPFALYYYSLYAPPLRFLQSHEATAFLTLSILPHFTHHDSFVIHFFQLLSWPIIIVGLILFLIGFGKIYWSKVKGTGNVESGLYGIIRHPQYIALAILGLGCIIYWSRFVAYAMYVTMLFFYYFLAKSEERLCLQRFGDPYRRYLESTGMFLPRFIERRFPRIPISLPKQGSLRLFVVLGTYLLYLTTFLILGIALRNYALSHIATYSTNQLVAVSVARLDRETLREVVEIASNCPEVQLALGNGSSSRLLLYVVPREWTIPELGMIGTKDEHDMVSNPGTHGNSPEFDRTALVVLFTEPIMPSHQLNILESALSYSPILEAFVDLKGHRVVSIKERTDKGKWEGIPVPIF